MNITEARTLVAPLHLRQANVKRWLDKRTSRTKVELDAKDLTEFKALIRANRIPVEVKYYSGAQAELRAIFDPKDPSYGFYVLEIGEYKTMLARQLFYVV